MARPLLGFAAGGKRRESEELGQRWSFLSTQGVRERAGASGTRERGSVATAMASLQGENDGIFAGNPLAAFSFFVFFI